MKLSRRWKGVIIAGISLAICLNAIGYLIGKLNSPRYDNELEAFQYVISEVQYVFHGDEISGLRVVAGPRIFAFDIESGKIETSLRSPAEIQNLERPRRNRLSEMSRMMEWIGISSAVPGGALGAAKYIKYAIDDPPIIRAARTSKRFFVGRVVAITAGLGVSAGYLGYRLGYLDEVDYENPLFQEVLGSPAIYEKIASEVLLCEKLGRIDSKIYNNYWVERRNMLKVSLGHGDSPFFRRYGPAPFQTSEESFSKNLETQEKYADEEQHVKYLTEHEQVLASRCEQLVDHITSQRPSIFQSFIE